MTPLNLIDRKIIGTNVYIQRQNKTIIFRMKRSPYSVKIPMKINSYISYLTGVIVGNGNISIIPRKISKYPRTKIKIINSSERFLKYINNIFEYVFGIKGKLYRRTDNNYILEVNNKIVCLFFIRIIGLKAKKKIGLKVPQILRSKYLFKYFLAGLIDTDGYYSKNRFGIMMTGKNFGFLKEIQTLSKKFYNLKFLGPHKDSIILNGKMRKRAQINLSTYDNNKFRKIIPLKIKGGPGENRTLDLHLS